MIAAVVAAAAVAAAEPVGARLLASAGGGVVSVAPDGARRRLLPGDDAAWSPDGTLVAYADAGDLWLANADGSGRRKLTATPNVVESEPAWAPGGRTLAYTATVADGGRQIRVLTLPGGATRSLAGSEAEEWSPTFARGRLAFVSTRLGAPAIFVARADGTNVAPFRAPDPGATAEPTELAWSPDATRLAYAVSGAVVVDDGTAPLEAGRGDHPVWSPAGERLAFAAVADDGARTISVVDATGAAVRTLGPGTPLDWRRVPLGRPLFPDLAQRPPSGLELMTKRGRFLLGFTSLVDNRGPGVLWIRATRAPGSSTMTASQLVRLAGGGVRVVPNAGFLRYTVAPPHYHWHWLGFDRYELRRADDFDLVVRDRKSGFCIADHHSLAPGVPHGPPRFRGNCGQFHPTLRAVEEGSSVGYTDRYPAHFHGQSLDLTRVPRGLYWLVHRANSDFGLRERSYENNAASLLVRITWPHGRRSAPRVVPLRACARERCVG